jgi:hypothetical protein
MKKTSTVRVKGNMIFKGHKLTIGVDLGDRWSCYCVLDEAGKIILEQEVATTPEAMKQVFAKIPQSLIAMETGTHSPWVSRLLTEPRSVAPLLPSGQSLPFSVGVGECPLGVVEGHDHRGWVAVHDGLLVRAVVYLHNAHLVVFANYRVMLGVDFASVLGRHGAKQKHNTT